MTNGRVGTAIRATIPATTTSSVRLGTSPCDACEMKFIIAEIASARGHRPNSDIEVGDYVEYQSAGERALITVQRCKAARKAKS